MNAWLSQDDIKAVAAELVGTFIFFFIGAGSIISMKYISAATDTSLLIVALAHGLVLSVVITAIGHVSGGHVNPAVTIALWVAQRISSTLAILYIAAQLVGGVIAGLLLKAIFSSAIWEPVHLGTPFLASGVKFETGVLIEAILTFFLVFAVFGTAVDPRHPRVGGFGIGLTVTFDILVGGPLTGGAMNPARAFGPALVANYWSNHLVYWIGPILGGILAALIYGYILMPHEEIDIGSAPATPGSDILPVPAPETNPFLDEETDYTDSGLVEEDQSTDWMAPGARVVSPERDVNVEEPPATDEEPRPPTP